MSVIKYVCFPGQESSVETSQCFCVFVCFLLLLFSVHECLRFASMLLCCNRKKEKKKKKKCSSFLTDCIYNCSKDDEAFLQLVS